LKFLAKACWLSESMLIELVRGEFKSRNIRVIDTHFDQVLVEFHADFRCITSVELIQVDLVVLHGPQNFKRQVETKLVYVIIGGDLLQTQISIRVYSEQVEQLRSVHASGRLLQKKKRQRLTIIQVFVGSVCDAMKVERDLEPLGYDLEGEGRVQSKEIHGQHGLVSTHHVMRNLIQFIHKRKFSRFYNKI
jgi:hypothetical protein